MMGRKVPGVGEDAEEQNGEDEHDAGGGHGTNAAGAGDETAQLFEVGKEVDYAGGVLRVSHKEEARDDAGNDGDCDQGYQGGRFLCHDQHEHDYDGQES